MSTADLCDEFDGSIQVAEPILRSFGGAKSMGGEIVTIRLQEDITDLKTLLGADGRGKIIVIDARGAYCAVFGDRLAGLAVKNNWAGVVVNGYVRDTAEISKMPIGVFALGTCPRKSRQKATAELGVELDFAAVRFSQGHYVYADEDGIITSKTPLVIPS